MAGLFIGAGAVLGAGLPLLAGLWYRERCERRTARRRWEDRRELVDALNVVTSEEEACAVLSRHVERALGEPATIVVSGADETEPCLAARLGQEHVRDPEREPLLSCEACASLSASSACMPLVVCGEAIGAVRVERPGGFGEIERSALRDSVAQAAPTLVNLRNRAAAGIPASVDPLTGLPNSRAVRDTLKRMAAQAGRTITPLSVILFDLDHFKRINENFGHDRGDDALAAVGEMLTSDVRSSDYAGRYGGEEFIVLLPDTDREGALVLSEKLRRAVENIMLPGIEGRLSASFGVASLPADGGDGDALVRLADRALHAAKAAGRNRVEVAGLSIAPGPEVS